MPSAIAVAGLLSIVAEAKAVDLGRMDVGFRDLAIAEASPELLALRRLEGKYGLPSDRRVLMRLDW